MQSEGKLAGVLIQSARRAHAAGVTLRMRQKRIELSEDAGPECSNHGPPCEELLDYLVVALNFARPVLLHDHIRWLKCAFVARGTELRGLRRCLECMRDELNEELPEAAARPAVAYVEGALRDFDQAPDCVANPLDGVGPHVDLARRYLLAVLECRRENAIDLAIGALQLGLSVTDLYTHVLAPVQVEVGLMWQRGEIHVAEEHLSSRVTEQVMAIVNAKMPRAPRNGRRVMISSANGDLHEIGARMVADHFEMAGWDTIHLGASTPPDDIARAVDDFEVDVLAIAAKLPLHLSALADMIAAVRAGGTKKPVRILVGGAPFLLVPDLWKLVGADAMAKSPVEAVEVARGLVS